MIEARYRSDYAGEFVVTETRWSGGKKQQTREFVPNPIENHHISGRAACIGHDCDRHKFDFAKLVRHRGGLLGSKKLQTYGVGHIAKFMRLDFVVETNPDQLDNLVDSGYNNDNIVYTSSKNCLNRPGLFYLIPYNPHLLDLVALAYLACFDGHQEIFLLGYNRDTPIETQSWQMAFVDLITAYPGVRFYFVGEPTNMFSEWLDMPNAEAMTYRNFISYCDV